MSAVRSPGIFRRLLHSTDRLMLIQFALLVLALTSIGDGLAKLVSSIDSNPTFFFALLGTFIGWQLARSSRNVWVSAGLTLLSGALILLFTVGGLASALWAFIVAVFTLKLFPLGQLADTSRIAVAWDGMGETLGGLLSRFTGWFQHLADATVIPDPLVLGILWGLALWLLAGWAAWMVRRRSLALLALLPGLVLLAWASFYTSSRQSLPALLFVGAELVALQVVQHYRSSRQRWQAAGLGLDRVDVEPALAFSTLALTLLLVIVGALTPSLSIKQMASSIDRFFESRNDSLAEAFGLQATPGADSSQAEITAAGISNKHDLSGYPNLSPAVVMTVSVDGYEPPPEDVIQRGEYPEPPIRYYWRSQTFDFYTGRGWALSSLNTADIDPGQWISPGGDVLPDGFQLVTQHVTRRLQGQAVLVTGELLSLDQVATVSRRSLDDFASATTRSNAYTAESRVPFFTVGTLRLAGSDYPEQIRQVYLQLPDDLPVRVRELAFQITAPQSNPYDQASAIETYLRQFPYTLEVPAPPSGRDTADYFLFDLQRGYCDYTATTMVVLARAVGIPARLVTGYSRGNYVPADDAFIVRLNNAHAWPELYFPGIGWIEFEPTSGQPAITRLYDSGAPLATDQPPLVPAPPVLSASVRLWHTLKDIPSAWYTALGIVLFLALLIPLEGWLLNLQKPARALSIIQQRLYRLGHRWDLPYAGALTPDEFTAALLARLETHATTSRLTALMTNLRRDLEWQTDLYVRSLYADRPPTHFEHRRAVRRWLDLKYRLWGLRLRFWRNL